MKTALIFAHPYFEASKANRALLDAVRELPEVEVADLHALYPDGRIDVDVELERLLSADRIVLQFPMFWYSTPPLLKQWQDEVLTPAYYITPEVGDQLKGKPVRVVTTLSGEPEAYQSDGRVGLTVEELLHPLRATARRCGWVWEAPFFINDMRDPSPEQLAVHAARYRALLDGELGSVAA